MLDKLVTIQLDKERHMRLSLKGMIEYGKLTNQNLLEGFNFKSMNLEEVGALLWACLIHEDRDLSLDDVLCMIDVGNLTDVIDALTKCISQSLVEKKAGKPPLPRKSRPG